MYPPFPLFSYFPWSCAWDVCYIIFCHFCIYIPGNREFVLISIVQFMMSAYSRVHFGLQIAFVCLYITPFHYHHCANFIWRHWTYEMRVRYNLSSVWVTWSIFSQLSIIQYVGLCVFSLPICFSSSSNFISRRIQYDTFHTHNISTISQMYSSGGCQRSSVAHRADNRSSSFVMIERIYILCLIIIIIKSEVSTITHCLGLGHETMVCAVCLSIFLCHSIDVYTYTVLCHHNTVNFLSISDKYCAQLSAVHNIMLYWAAF